MNTEENRRSFEEFSQSITKQLENYDYHLFKSDKFDKYVREGNTEGILNELNDPDKIMTPSFILRRQAQELYKDIFEDISGEIDEAILTVEKRKKEAEKKLDSKWTKQAQKEYDKAIKDYSKIIQYKNVSDFVDLHYQMNVMWTAEESDENYFTVLLAKKLADRIEKDTGIKLYTTYASGQKDYEMLIRQLREGIPRDREVAWKFVFAFQMSLETANKYFVSGGLCQLSERSPLDYIGMYMCSRRLKYTDFITCFKRYEEGRPENDIAVGEAVRGGTQLLRQYREGEPYPEEIPVNEEGMCKDAQVLIDELIRFMYEKDAFFTRRRSGKGKTSYIEGYSLVAKDLYMNFLMVLAKIYPHYKDISVSDGIEKIVTKPVKFYADGTPKVSSLLNAMYEAHGWTFYDTETREIAYTMDPEREAAAFKNTSKERTKHDDQPFNRFVYLFCATYYSRMNKIRRLGSDTPENAVSVERRDVLLLSFMFISGYLKSFAKEQREIRMFLEKEEKNLLNLNLANVCNELSDCKRGVSIERLIECINTIMAVYKMPGFYDALIFDRFILFALMCEIKGDPLMAGNMLLDGYIRDGDVVWKVMHNEEVLNRINRKDKV